MPVTVGTAPGEGIAVLDGRRLAAIGARRCAARAGDPVCDPTGDPTDDSVAGGLGGGDVLGTRGEADVWTAAARTVPLGGMMALATERGPPRPHRIGVPTNAKASRPEATSAAATRRPAGTARLGDAGGASARTATPNVV